MNNTTVLISSIEAVKLMATNGRSSVPSCDMDYIDFNGTTSCFSYITTAANALASLLAIKLPSSDFAFPTLFPL